MYDGLYSMLPSDAEIVVQADHPTLNRQVAELLGSGSRIDVVSTHSKYAPSQEQWLRPLDDLVPKHVVDDLAPRAVDLCRFGGSLLSVPRNVDVRVLWYRSDLMSAPPGTWASLMYSPHAFGFPGRESGLFGTFFEIVTAHGGRLFDEDAQPVMRSRDAVEAVETLCAVARRAPADLPEWHYDQVDAALLDGRIAMAAAWPGGYGAIRACDLYDRLRPAPYFAGDARRVSYAGCHSWAIPKSCGDVGAAVDLVVALCSAEAARLEAAGGGVCAHVEAFAGLEPRDEVDAQRLDITRRTITDAMITYPPLARFPEVEDAGWSSINAALRGKIGASQAVESIQRAAEEALK
jgi:multiple sugar transport system substrate-binding protein